MTPTEDATPSEADLTPRRWLKFTDDQRAAAAELARRAERLRANSEDGISVTEAVELAAIQMGIEP
jgi:hypothetical protein